MKRIRFLISVIVCVMLVLGLTACGSKASDEGLENGVQTVEDLEENSESSDENATDDKDETEPSQDETSESDANSEEAEGQNQTDSGKDTLVVYFSATGTTKGVAEKIAAVTDADLYEIVPAEEYTSNDLNYNDANSRTTKEQNDASVRPEISSETIDLSGYTTIYIGYPIWHGQEPRIMDTFVETYDFGSVTVIPFCTSGSSSIGQSGSNLASNAGSGKWLEGQRFDGNVSEDDLKEWIDGLH